MFGRSKAIVGLDIGSSAVKAVEPAGPPAQSDPSVVSSADNDALRAREGFLVGVLHVRAQRERASLS